MLLLAIDDPKPGIGSGSATLNALLVVTEHLSARAGYTVCFYACKLLFNNARCPPRYLLSLPRYSIRLNRERADLPVDAESRPI